MVQKQVFRINQMQSQVAGHLIPKLNRHFIFAHYLENNQYSNSPALQLVPNRFHRNAGFSRVILFSYMDQELKFFSCKQCFGTLLRSPGFNFIRQSLIDNKVFTSAISIVWCQPQPTLGVVS